MIKLMLPASAFLALAACVTEPVVSDFNGASVKIQTDAIIAPKQSDATDAEATRICKAGGKKRAEYASSRDTGNYRIEHLYLCLG